MDTPSKKPSPAVHKVALDLRKGSRDAGLAMEERKEIKQLKSKAAKLETKVERLEQKVKPAPKPASPKKRG